MSLVDGIVLGGYASLLFEIFVFRVPSVASTYELVGRTTERNARERLLLFALPTLVSVAVFMLPLALVFLDAIPDWFVPLPAVTNSSTQIVGAVLVVCGRVFTLAAVGRLRTSIRESSLVTDGPFARSRNPALVGLHVFFVGNCLIFPSLLVWIGFGVWAIHMHSRVRIEEDYLHTKFGDRFDAYARRVRRYV